MAIASTDADGFVKDGGYMTVVIPSQMMAFVFRVKRRGNVGYNKIHYGSLPLVANQTLPKYDGTSAVVPEAGVMPAFSYTPTGITFPMNGVYDENDMWYTPATYHDRLMHVKMHTEPNVLRVGLEIPKGVKQYRFQRDSVVTGVDKALGFQRGDIETVFFPELHSGFVFGNDTNIDLRTKVTFEFAEYVIEVPDDPSLIYDILTGAVDSYRLTLPIAIYDSSISIAVKKAYGFDGFPMEIVQDKTDAIALYDSLIKKYYNNG